MKTAVAVTYPALALLLIAATGVVCAEDLKGELDGEIASIEERVIEWRHDFHRNPELSNREFRTARIVAQHLQSLGMEVRTGIAHTGVVGILRGGAPGPVVGLRADMDALPVTEQTGLPYASKVTTIYKDRETGVMHACGHDAHTAILMGAAEVLAGIRERLPGTIVFVFQPAEEGAPAGEDGGAGLMLKEGLLEGPDAPEAIFGLHVLPRPAGHLFHKPGPIMAASDQLEIRVRGKQTHGSMPWRGIDPITVSAQILLALQTIASRQIDLIKAPAVISAGSIHAGNRGNIIPEEVLIEGTIRTFDRDMQKDIHSRIQRTVSRIADSAGASADVRIDAYAPVTWNDPELAARMAPSLVWAAGEKRVHDTLPLAGAEDFALYQERIPGFYFFLGINREGVAEGEAAPNHSPHFIVNDDALITGVRAMSAMAVDYLTDAEEAR